MQEQITPEEKQPGYITLKEASERFGYTQDYLGQLIRKGKLEGKLVYSHVAWVTTPEAVLAYKEGGKRGKQKIAPDVDRLSELVTGDEVHHEEDVSATSRWLIRLFRVLLFLAVLGVMFVFYLLTTAFGAELQSGTLVARASVIIGDLQKDQHD